jgi:TolB-like protein/AraC-like DNA-binding protein
MANSSPADAQFLEKLHRIIQDKMTDSQFGVSELAREMGMSRSNLHRRVSEITGKTVISLISEARLKRAMELLKEGLYTVSEVSWRAGFGSVTYFNKCFHDYYGFPPGEARNRDLTKIPEDAGQSRGVTAGKPKQRNKILIAVLSLIVLASVVVVFILVKSSGGDHKEIEKTIAVLPFINDSPDTTNVYFINGIMEGIINNLSKIKDLVILSRTSVEQYRNNKTKTIPQIARELGVNYIVEGSGQKYGDQVMLSIQLLETGSDKHLLSEQYNRKWEDIFSLQSEIATQVASGIKAVITPEEVELIEKKPTENIIAYNLVLKGGELGWIGQASKDTNLQRQAGDFLREAIRIDSTFANAYMMLGWNVANLSNDYDSALFYANRALHFDDKNSKAYCLKGWIYLWHTGEDKLKEAEDAFRLAIKFNPNFSVGYHYIGGLYLHKGDYPQWVENVLKALKLEKDPWSRWNYLRSFCPHLTQSGFNEEALIFAQEVIDFNNDSLQYYWGKTLLHWNQGNYDSAYAIARIAVRSKKWTDDFNPLTLAQICISKRDFPAALKHVGEYMDEQKQKGAKVTPSGMIGYIYLKNGEKEKATYHFDGYISNQLKLIEESHSEPNFWNYLTFTYIYSAMGEKEKAMENLRKAVKCKNAESITLNPFFYKNSPIIETVQNEPEFRKFVQQKEDKYEADRVKIKKLFREAGIYD